MAKNQPVVPQSGKWAVKGDGSKRASKVVSTQQEAIDVADQAKAPLHIASLSLTDGIADSVWLEATRLVRRLRPFGSAGSLEVLSSATDADAMGQ